jgi:hypothetical protein
MVSLKFDPEDIQTRNLDRGRIIIPMHYNFHSYL